MHASPATKTQDIADLSAWIEDLEDETARFCVDHSRRIADAKAEIESLRAQ